MGADTSTIRVIVVGREALNTEEHAALKELLGGFEEERPPKLPNSKEAWDEMCRDDGGNANNRVIVIASETPPEQAELALVDAGIPHVVFTADKVARHIINMDGALAPFKPSR